MVFEIVKYGDPVLQTKGRAIGEVSEAIRQLASDMLETMYAANGLGLAAQQIGLPLQIAVVDVTAIQEDRPSTLTIDGLEAKLEDWMPMTLINPQLDLGPAKDSASEGCLSFPDFHGDVQRSSKIKVKAQMLDGRHVEFEAGGMLARAIQHEVDHLNGVLFISRMNSATKASFSGRLKRLHREGASNPTKGKPRPAKPKPVKKAASAAEEGSN